MASASGGKTSRAAETKVSKARALSNYVSALFNRSLFAARMGLTFRGKRDMYQVLGYAKTLRYTDFLIRYERGGIAHRIVTAPTLATWREGIVVDGGDAFNTAWDNLLATHPVWAILEKLDRMLGLGQYAILFIGLDDGGATNQPVRKNKENQVLFLQPYSEGTAVIKAYDDNSSSPRFGKPSEYTLTILGKPLTSMNIQAPQSVSTTTLDADYTRCLHIAEDALEDGIFGIPRLSSVYNYLDDLDKVCGGSAEAFWLIANRGMQADVDKEMELDADDAAALEEEMEEYQHQLRRFIRTRGVKITNLGADNPTPLQAFQVVIDLISGTTGIPQRILMGSEVGSLASQQDRANWAERITERRQTFAEPYVLKPFIQALVDASALPPPVDLTIKWPSAFTLSPLEESQTSAQTARSIVNMSRQAAEGNPITTIEEAREVLGLPRKIPTGDTLFQVLPSKLVVPSTSITPPAPTYDQTQADKLALTKATPKQVPPGAGKGKPNGATPPAPASTDGGQA